MMQPTEDSNSHSVARKLLRELSAVSLNGHGVLRRLQAGSLMGCLTHLSVAGKLSLLRSACTDYGRLDLEVYKR